MKDEDMNTTVTTYLNAIPLRSSASHRSEMVSQVLFGEDLIVMAEDGDFYQVLMTEANYEGWVQKTQVVAIDNSSVKDFVVGLEDVFYTHNGVNKQLYLGTKITNDSCIVGNLRIPSLQDLDVEFPKLIAHYLYTPYLWGGRSVAGIDCSGFSQIIFAYFGVSLARDAYQQADQGYMIDFLSQAKLGDLAFFDNAEGKITHVGILLSAQEVIHASGEVRVDMIDQEGIFNRDLMRYTHKLRVIKRYF